MYPGQLLIPSWYTDDFKIKYHDGLLNNSWLNTIGYIKNFIPWYFDL